MRRWMGDNKREPRGGGVRGLARSRTRTRLFQFGGVRVAWMSEALPLQGMAVIAVLLS
jgi:hypothetical protein